MIVVIVLAIVGWFYFVDETALGPKFEKDLTGGGVVPGEGVEGVVPGIGEKGDDDSEFEYPCPEGQDLTTFPVYFKSKDYKKVETWEPLDDDGLHMGDPMYRIWYIYATKTTTIPRDGLGYLDEFCVERFDTPTPPEPLIEENVEIRLYGGVVAEEAGPSLTFVSSQTYVEQENNCDVIVEKVHTEKLIMYLDFSGLEEDPEFPLHGDTWYYVSERTDTDVRHSYCDCSLCIDTI